MAGWTIPDKGEGDADVQSIMFQEYIDVLIDGIQGLNCVVSGCDITGGADMTPAVAKGAVISNGTLFAVAAADVTISTAHATLPRIDLIVIDSSGAKQVRAGTAATNAKPPARSTNDVVLAAVYVPAADTSIETTKITDMRVIRDRNITLKKTTSPVSFANSSATNTYFTVTLPSGLFLSGKVCRVRCGGTYLANSGTACTWTIRINYGGTTMFGDVSLAPTAGATRGGWHLEFDLVAQANNDQQMNGFITMANTPSTSRLAGSVAGLGDILGSNAVAVRPVTTPLNGSAAVDSDAGDRVLEVQWTMSVANAALDTFLEYGTAELL